MKDRSVCLTEKNLINLLEEQLFRSSLSLHQQLDMLVVNTAKGCKRIYNSEAGLSTSCFSRTKHTFVGQLNR